MCLLLGQRWGRLERLTIGLTDLKETGSTTIKKNNNNNSVVVVQKKKKKKCFIYLKVVLLLSVCVRKICSIWVIKGKQIYVTKMVKENKVLYSLLQENLREKGMI